MFLVGPAPGKDIDLTVPVYSHLDSDMCRSTESIQSQPLTGLDLAEPQGPIAYNPRTQEWRGFFLREDLRNDVCKCLGDNDVFRIPAVNAVAGEAGFLTQILFFLLAVPAFAADGIQPGHAYSVSHIKTGSEWPTLLNSANNLMTRDDGKFYLGQFSLHSVEICVTNAADMDPDEDLIFRGLADRAIDQGERIIFDRSEMIELHGFHDSNPNT
jgi:hypothetical protein